MINIRTYGWGKQLPTKVKAVASPLPHSEDLIGWDDLDHSQTLSLGVKKATSVVFKKEAQDYFVLRFCLTTNYTVQQSQLVELAQDKEITCLLRTRCIFTYARKIFVGSEFCDMALADIIDCQIPFTESQLSNILYQVARSIATIQDKSASKGEGLSYGSLRASNVFVARDSCVKLATFGNGVCPEQLTGANHDKDARDLGGLAMHMLSRSSEEADIGTIIALDAELEPSPQFLDFLELCQQEAVGMLRILKHPFLNSSNHASLSRLVLNAERCVSRPCFS